MNTALVYVTLMSLAIATDGKECNSECLAFWRNILSSQNINNYCATNNCQNNLLEKRGVSEELQQTSNSYRAISRPTHWTCPCESQHGILDLGPGNYPRYLSSAHCVVKPCHKFNQCKLIHYKVHILRRRDLNDNDNSSEEQYIEQSILPESLSIEWQLKPMRTAVACVADSEARKV